MSETRFELNLASLIEAASGVVAEVDLDRVLRRLVSEARRATGAKYAALGVVGEHGALSEFIHEGMKASDVARIGHPPVGKGVLGTLIRENTALRLESISDHPDSFGFPEGHPPMSSFLGVPVVAGSRPFGNLYLTEKEGGFTSDDQQIVEALSRIAGSAVNTARLHERIRNVAVLEDRERIARDLHDSVIQDLFAVGLSLQGLSERIVEPDASATLENSVDRLDDAVESLRTYIFQLTTGSKTRPALDDRLQELVSRMGTVYPSQVSLAIAASFEDEHLEDEIVKLVTESLSNALRHSKATKVKVEVEEVRDECLIVVADDGVGFQAGQPTQGLGLSSMADRAERLGGILDVFTSPGRGTRVEARLPIT